MEDKFWLAKIVNDSNDTIHNKVRPKLTIEAQVTYMRDDNGTHARLALMPPEAFAIQPYAFYQQIPGLNT